MATAECDWLDGDLLVELASAGDATRVEVVTDLGGGLRERVFAPLVFQAPLVEFGRAVARVSHMIAPLRIRAKTAQSLILGASQTVHVRKTSMPPRPSRSRRRASSSAVNAAPSPPVKDADDALRGAVARPLTGDAVRDIDEEGTTSPS